MRRLLQSVLHNLKTYDRPHDKWVCGRAAEGCPCIYGPNLKGECRATGQCLPAKTGDRWICTRTAALGGTCEPGPGPEGECGCPVPPCRPQRSLRARRGELTWLAGGLALGIVILILLGPKRTTWSSPGPLTSQHAVSAQDCAACHLATPGLTLSAAARSERIREHDQLCIHCHDLGPNAESPHGVAAADLAALTRSQAPATGGPPVLLAVAQALGPSAGLACATCHREHRGAEADLKVLSDHQCQTCHQSAFPGFAQGHPEFAGYPYSRRTRLQFDHVSHLQKHFTDARLPGPGPTSCTQCHEPAADGGKMLVRGFAQSCASCHAAQIEGVGRVGARGVEFFRLPDIDVAALRAAGHEVGEWPAYCEGGLTPFMRWMLEEGGLADALSMLEGVNLARLAAATPAQKAAAARLLWGIKGLFADLVTHGQQVILNRLGRTAPARLTTADRAGQFSADVALAAHLAWLPNLLHEVAAHRRGERVVGPARISAGAPARTIANAAVVADEDDLLSGPPLEAPSIPVSQSSPGLRTPAELQLDDAEARVIAGGWYRLDDSYTLHYRPVGHADTFIQAWLDGTAASSAVAAKRIFSQLSAESAPGGCVKCHTVDQTATTVVNWRTATTTAGHQPFTKFKHAAHFSLMGDQGCMTCHTFAVGADYAGSFGANRNPLRFRSNFAPLTKDTCVNCHQPGRTGESCLQCHNYHTGEMQPLRKHATGLPALLRSPPPPPRR